MDPGGTGGGAVIGFEDCAADASGHGMRASRTESVAERMEVSSIFLNCGIKKDRLDRVAGVAEVGADGGFHWVATGSTVVLDEPM